MAVDGLIYVIGGINCDTYEVYDPKCNKWTLKKKSLLSKKHNLTRAFEVHVWFRIKFKASNMHKTWKTTEL